MDSGDHRSRLLLDEAEQLHLDPDLDAGKMAVDAEEAPDEMRREENGTMPDVATDWVDAESWDDAAAAEGVAGVQCSMISGAGAGGEREADPAEDGGDDAVPPKKKKA